MITYFKQFVVDRKFQWQMFIGIILGIVVAIVYSLDLFALVGMVANVPYVGSVLTGVGISRGSNYMYDLIDLVGGLVKRFKT